MSFRRASESGDVLGRFYDLFLASDPEVGRRFENTDFDRQKALLQTSLKSAIFAATGDHYARVELERIRTSHGRAGLHIPDYLYDLWRASLIQAVSEYDPEFRDSMRAQWHSVLQPAIDFLTTES